MNIEMPEIEIEARAEMKQDRYGFVWPTLVLTTTTANTDLAFRRDNMAALVAAAEIESALLKIGDKKWAVGDPIGKSKSLPHCLCSTWDIVVSSGPDAKVEVAMKALKLVAAKLNTLPRE